MPCRRRPWVNQEATSSDSQYFDGARDAFRSGNYREALRLAGHAAVDSPQDPAVHELMSLALFASKDYRGAALEAHAALSLGPAIDLGDALCLLWRCGSLYQATQGLGSVSSERIRRNRKGFSCLVTIIS